MKKRLKRNDPGINELDRACKDHDIAYEKSKSKSERNKADKILAEKAWKRAKTSEAGWSERLASAATAGVMTVKSKLGFGLKQRRRRRQQKPKTIKKKKYKRKKTKKKSVKKQRKMSIKRKKKKNVWNKSNVQKLYHQAVRNAKDSIAVKQPVIAVKEPKSIRQAVKIGVNAAKAIFNQNEQKPNKTTTINNLPRVIPVPKIGGVIPLISILSGLSALGGVMGGVAGITNAITRISDAKRNFKESQRHNETMEAIALGKTSKKLGSGVFVGPYKKGLGLFLHEIPKN